MSIMKTCTHCKAVYSGELPDKCVLCGAKQNKWKTEAKKPTKQTKLVD